MAKLSQALSSDFSTLPLSEQTQQIKTPELAREAQAKTLEKQQVGLKNVAEMEAKAGITAAEEKAKPIEAYAQGATEDIQKSKAEKEKFPFPEFHPTKDNAQDLMELFSVINVVGMAMGALGKNNALGAMKSMTGMMKGYREGRKDLFEKEKVEFDKNFQAMKTKHEEIVKDLEQALKVRAIDKEKGDAMANIAIAKAQSPILTEKARIQGLVPALELYKQIGETYDKQNEKISQRAFDLKKIELEHQNRLKELQAKSSLKQDDVVAELDSLGVHIADKKDRATVTNSVGSMAELKALKNEVINNPSLVGRQGQIAQFTDRYIKSFKTGEPVDESKVSQADQAALLFAKKYASMLTRYELALAGTARGGSTVAFQTRYNNLLSQNQFNAASLAQLFDDMQVEVARGAMEKSNKLTYGMMDDMSNKLISNLPSEAGATTKPAQDMKDSAIQYFGKYEPEKFTYGFENGKFYRDAK
jgi:hypothetical protein